MHSLRSGFILLLIGATVAAMAPVQAQPHSYPSKPIRLIVPSTPGGPLDTIARLVSERLSPAVGRQIVVDNRSGANGIIGMELAAKAAHDGHTLVLTHVGALALNVHYYRKLPYDPLKDFVPVSRVAFAPQILLANPSVPAKSVQELIRMARARPGQLTYGALTGSTLSMELFKNMAGADIMAVPYRGAAQALADLVGGQISLVLGNIIPTRPFITAGQLHPLAVTARTRSPILPDVPTMIEAGLSDYEAVAWFGVVAPRGTPDEIISKLNREIHTMLKLRDVREQLHNMGAEASHSGPGQFARYIEAEIAKWGNVARAVKLERR